MAKRVAATLQTPHIELDALHWLPDYQERPDDEFRELVSSIVAEERWVVDGNYNMVRDIVWQRAFQITEDDDAGSLYARVKDLASVAIGELLPLFEGGE